VTTTAFHQRVRTLAVIAIAAALTISVAPSASATPPAKPALTTWGATAAVRAQVIIGSTLYLGGSFTSMVSPDGVTTVARKHLAAIDLTTGELLGWSPSANGSVLAMATDGSSLYVGGSFTSIDSTSRPRVAAIDTSGALLPWASGANATVHAVYLRGSTVYIGGAFTTLGGQPRDYVGATTTAGALLPWDPEANDRVNAITSVASGNIVVGGAFDDVGGESNDHIAPLDPVTGEPQPWDHASGEEVEDLITGPDDNVYGAIVGAGGKVRSWTNEGNLRWTVYTDGDVNAVTYHDGQVIAGGHWVYMTDGTIKLPKLAAFDPETGTPDTSWKPRPNKQPWSFASDGSTLAIGGVFTKISGATYRRVAVYKSS
jgi:trimeric autotransporter adhesin